MVVAASHLKPRETGFLHVSAGMGGTVVDCQEPQMGRNLGVHVFLRFVIWFKIG